jgi:hypothetical protein
MSQIKGIGIRIVQRIILKWKTADEPSSAHQNCCWAKILDDRDRRSLKRLVKSSRWCSIHQLTSVSNQGAKRIFTCTVRRELKETGMRSCVAKGKPLGSAANRKKRILFARDQKLGHWAMETCDVRRIEIQLIPEWWTRQSEAIAAWGYGSVMHRSHCAVLWWKCDNLGMFHLCE